MDSRSRCQRCGVAFLVCWTLAFAAATERAAAVEGLAPSIAWRDELLAAPGSKVEVSPEPMPSAKAVSPMFSLTYDGISSQELLGNWPRRDRHKALDGDRVLTTSEWSDPSTGLRITCENITYSDYPAVEWLLYLENTGRTDTKIVADVQTCDLTFRSPRSEPAGYRLYRTHGGVYSPRQFAFSVETIDAAHPRRLIAGAGRSSTEDLPFFKIDTGRGSAILAVGWSGCWKAELNSPDDKQLHVTAGLDKTHFLLHPGEKVRSPRMLMLCWAGDTWDGNARFRELMYKHYVARRSGKPILPMLFCNTCFTRGGGWLNECNAENQISLINAYAPLGLEALLTDAGWFRGGWPRGAGNWTPREDAYPQGMGPVAAAAKAKDMIYGLWFEPERVVADTDLHRNHPEWLLGHQEGKCDTYLLDFGLPAVRDYFFGIVEGFMNLPGFRFYRQDFNMDPLAYWRFTDGPDRQGVSEMKYVEGLYAYWDRIATTWPDSVREECAGGGHRIDLETVMRMHLHQKTDYWFNNEVDQAALWSTSQYLPNCTIVAHLNRLDDYSFHSTLASSLCLGWIADAADFDVQRARLLTDRYLAVRHLLIGAWYPLLPYSREPHDWIGSQFHRADLNEGMLLLFRRAESPYLSVELALRGLQPDLRYVLVSDAGGALGTFSGAQLGSKFTITLPERHRSDLIVYRME